jgi:uncharacterized protein (TIRG00374 family)
MKEIMKDKKLIAINILLAILKWTLSSAVMWLIFISLSAKVNFIHVFVISAITIIISLIPLTPSGIGTKEGAAIYLYSLLGVSFAISGAAYILINLINYIIAGFYMIFSRNEL